MILRMKESRARIIFSNSFEIQEVRRIGRLEAGAFEGLASLMIRIMLEFFQADETPWVD